MHTGLLHFRRPLLCRRRGKNPLAFHIRGIRFRFGVSEGNENPRYARTQSTDKAANARMARINRNRGNLRLLRRICQPLRDYRMQPQDGELRPAAKPPCLPRLQPLAFSPLVRKFASLSCGPSLYDDGLPGFANILRHGRAEARLPNNRVTLHPIRKFSLCEEATF